MTPPIGAPSDHRPADSSVDSSVDSPADSPVDSSPSEQPPFASAAFLAALPARPGVYLFYGKDDAALYIGKANNLKRRVASYFRATGLSPKTRLMAAQIQRAEIQQTSTESEALLLENNLIKNQRPRYNISLRDDKSFPYIRLSAHVNAHGVADNRSADKNLADGSDIHYGGAENRPQSAAGDLHNPQTAHVNAHGVVDNRAADKNLANTSPTDLNPSPPPQPTSQPARLEAAAFPRFSFYRGRRARPHRYFGPYPNAAAVREVLGQVHKIFRLRQCNDAFFRSRSRPCLQYQIQRCSAPCVGRIAAQDYAQDVRQAEAMLSGDDCALLDELAARMESAAAALDYEAAAQCRDRIALLRRARSAQYVDSDGGDADIVAVARESGLVCFGVVSIRRGRNLGARFQVRKNPLEWSAAALLQAFLPQNYLGAAMPPEILLSDAISGGEALQQAFTDNRQHAHGEGGNLRRKCAVRIKQNCRAHRARWIEAARVNVADHLRSHLSQRSQLEAQFIDLAALLECADTPARLECFDISHTQGERPVGACVVFDKQGAVTSDYRRFNITGITPGDDYAAMRQALTRRYQRALSEDGKLPDVVLIDGGRGQLTVAAQVFEELQMSASILLVGVSKGAARRPGEEQLHRLGKAAAIIPGQASLALCLIQRVRDEAHRFAIAGHRHRRAKARTTSPLQRIAGVGEQRRRSLLRHFGGMREITRAGVEDLVKAPGISPALAARIHEQIHQ